jgi:type I site-specific restriction endonuclease
LSRFQDVETSTPVILTTSQLLTTGVDAPTCKNIVLARVVNSMTDFKQIIGRGTRVRDDYGKLWFNILDYTGTATRNFADPASTATLPRPCATPKRACTRSYPRSREVFNHSSLAIIDD